MRAGMELQEKQASGLNWMHKKSQLAGSITITPSCLICIKELQQRR